MKIWGMSDRGAVRRNNQDSYAFHAGEDNSYAVVCDGMGGAAAGEVASRLAAETFSREISRPARSLDTLMQRSVDRANSSVLEYTYDHPECAGMGTTLVAAVVTGNEATVINVGDSRCYYLDENGIRQISQDHSVVAELVRKGELTPQEARRHPRKNLITRCLGSEEFDRGDIFHQTMEPGSMLLLCSDGLTNQVLDQEILFEALYGGDRETCCSRLVDLTLRRGAPDNVTVVLMCAD